MRITGRVERKRVARRTKSEHEALVLRVGQRDYWLRRRGGSAFGDTGFGELVGKQIRGSGTLDGQVLILDEWQEVDMATPRGTARKRAATKSAAASPKRAASKTQAAKPKAGAKKTRAIAAAEAGEKIRHVVLLMMENRSFDQMLGGLSVPGLDGALPPGRSNSWQGVRYPQQAGAARTVDPDPKHERAHVRDQLANGNSGFVGDYAAAYPKTTPPQHQQVMSYFADGKLRALHDLAHNFVVCDQWYSSVPGPTWTNRLFAMSGTSLGRVEMPTNPLQLAGHKYGQPSIFRRLAEAKKSYRIYFGDFPLSLLLSDQRTPKSAKNFRALARFAEDARGQEADFPAFAFLEPDYLWPGANDDHPPTDVSKGQALIARVYRALRANEALWRSTLLVISYDEHGGFYDHVTPPAAIPPDDHSDEYGFTRLGVRVPAVLVSPWFDPQVCHEQFDHTSLLRLLQRKWGLGDLGRRTGAATDPLEVLQLRATPRTDAPQTVSGKGAAPLTKKAIAQQKSAPPLSAHQRAIVALSEQLQPPATAKKLKLGPKVAVKAAADTFDDATASSAAARARVRKFLDQLSAKG